MYTIQPVILAGGTGSRLWPLSRELYPKQLLQLTNSSSLLQTTVKRMVKLGDVLPPIIVVGEEHRFITKSQVGELELFDDYTILLEPLGRNTAPAICGAAHYVDQYDVGGTDGIVMLVLPSDHLIAKEEDFKEAVRQAAELAVQGRIVTFGINPERPETGYGYIEKGEDNEVLSFKEKPGGDLAQEYIAKGNYFWNSGMFAFTVKTFQAEMAKHAPVILEVMEGAIRSGKRDDHFFRFDPKAMADTPSDSIDYALMEKTECASVVTADLGWSDIGSWQALWEVLEKDGAGNVCQGDVLLEGTKNCLVKSDDKLIAAVGLEDTLVVETADAVLVASMAGAQDVKKIVEVLKKKDRKEFRYHRTVYRPWGSYTVLEEQQRFQMKKIAVNPGSKLSLQYHHHRHEHWVVVNGTAKITNGDETFLLHENQSTYIPAGVVHRLENPGVIPLELIEVQIGSYLGEDDIVRYDDDYGRDKS